MPNTETMLVNEAYGLIATDFQTPSAEDGATIRAEVPRLLSRLETVGLVTVPDTDDIGDEVFTPLATLLAHACARKFGLAGEAFGRLELDAQAARLQLREMQSQSTTDPVEAVYY